MLHLTLNKCIKPRSVYLQTKRISVSIFDSLTLCPTIPLPFCLFAALPAASEITQNNNNSNINKANKQHHQATATLASLVKCVPGY